MARNPIQIVLDTQNFVGQAEINPGGSNKDFYEGNDSEFIQHRTALLGQVNSLREYSDRHSNTNTLFAKVTLQSGAIAKSHRPINKIFNLKKHDYVGGSTIGSMLLEIDPEQIDDIYESISSAEDDTNLVRNNKGKLVAKPSKARSEVGAIQSISAWKDSDIRSFSYNQAIEWLSNKKSGHSYYVDLFYSPNSVEQIQNRGRKSRVNSALQSLFTNLQSAELPIEISTPNLDIDVGNLIIITISQDRIGDSDIHERLISILENSGIVRHIYLPDVISSEEVRGNRNSSGNSINSPSGENHAVVGIVDTGVADIENLNDWAAGSLDFISDINQNRSHGTFIAGLISGADQLNSYRLLSEQNCKYFDLDLHPEPSTNYDDYYPKGFVDFLDQLDAEIPEAKANGVRIFNMSLSVTTHIKSSSYSLFADMLDKISDKHDVIFVSPAGNLGRTLARNEWPSPPTDVLQMLADYRYPGQDRIFQPGDSIRSIVVGAIDPSDSVEDAKPAQYSRRGPGPSLGLKPDVAHIGGRYSNDSGLTSITPENTLVESCGTSYAAPLVAKTMAVLNQSIAGNIPRETLIALLIHNSNSPSQLSSTAMTQTRKDFVGAGIPNVSDDILMDTDHQVTLVFNGKIHNREELNFSFSWPQCLTDSEGKCRGDVQLTLAYSPPVDRNFDGEFVRLNIDAHLRQEQVDTTTGEIKFSGRLQGDKSHGYEKDLVEHGSKWWPIKIKKSSFRGIGASSQWRLVLSPLTRSDFIFPEGGVGFSIILSISDKSESQQVFQDMRSQLISSGIQIADIHNALRSRVR